jgi:ABC-type transport system involved in multi-copper enzyme maturation permease subunit
MYNLFQLTRNTFRESIREPIFYILLITALALIGNFPSFTLFVFNEQIKLVVDSAMATSMVFGLFAAVLCASHTVTREMRNGTVLLLMSKPVYRWNFVMAKILGIIGAVVLFVFICNVATVISVYIAKDQFRLDMTAYFVFFAILIVAALIGCIDNFVRGNSFSSVAVWATTIMLPIYCVVLYFICEHPAISLKDLLCALTLLFFSVSTMATITVLFSTRLEMVANLTCCSAVFFLGLISNYLFQRSTDSLLLDGIMRFFYALLPNWQFFWMADALASMQPIPFSYVLWSALYVILYISLCSLWAVGLFHSREIAKDSR